MAMPLTVAVKYQGEKWLIRVQVPDELSQLESKLERITLRIANLPDQELLKKLWPKGVAKVADTFVVVYQIGQTVGADGVILGKEWVKEYPCREKARAIADIHPYVCLALHNTTEHARKPKP